MWYQEQMTSPGVVTTILALLTFQGVCVAQEIQLSEYDSSRIKSRYSIELSLVTIIPTTRFFETNEFTNSILTNHIQFKRDPSLCPSITIGTTAYSAAVSNDKEWFVKLGVGMTFRSIMWSNDIYTFGYCVDCIPPEPDPVIVNGTRDVILLGMFIDNIGSICKSGVKLDYEFGINFQMGYTFWTYSKYYGQRIQGVSVEPFSETKSLIILPNESQRNDSFTTNNSVQFIFTVRPKVFGGLYFSMRLPMHLAPFNGYYSKTGLSSYYFTTSIGYQFNKSRKK